MHTWEVRSHLAMCWQASWDESWELCRLPGSKGSQGWNGARGGYFTTSEIVDVKNLTFWTENVEINLSLSWNLNGQKSNFLNYFLLFFLPSFVRIFTAVMGPHPRSLWDYDYCGDTTSGGGGWEVRIFLWSGYFLPTITHLAWARFKKGKCSFISDDPVQWSMVPRGIS